MPQVFSGPQTFDVDKLAAEVSTARSILEFSEGPYGNCISLPAKEDLASSYREHCNNVPFANALKDCRYLREIFDSLKAEKAAFRLLRRKGGAAYALHDDKDKGPNVFRFQIPIITNEKAFLLLTTDGADLSAFEALSSETRGESVDDFCFDLGRLDRLLNADFELYRLRPGQIYYFDTNKLHTLINAGVDERIVLSIDLIANDWLTEWMRTQLQYVVTPSNVPRTSAIRWQWDAFRHGVIRNV